jgi:hypothetical protein
MDSMSDTALPKPLVLTDALLAAMGGDRLVAAVFLTYQFEPPFFEDHILAPLCGLDARGSPTVRRITLEERLRDLDLLVLYDQRGLVANGPMRQAIRAVPLSWARGVVHAKHALLLVMGKGGTRSLILLTTSANLTYTGWWTNVEVADIERLDAGSATPLRTDLLELLRLLRTLGPSEEHVTLRPFEAFVRDELTDAAGLPRLWLGKETLANFLLGHIPVPTGRLEVIAPFVDGEGAPVATLAKALKPDEVVVWFPVDRDDLGAATEGWRDGVLKIANSRFGEIEIDRRLGAQSTAQRYVHAKATRITDPKGRRSWTLSGSPNLSLRGHAGCQTDAELCNVETAILRTSSDAGRWLRPLAAGNEPAPAARVEGPDDLAKALLVRLRYNWATRTGEIRLASTGGQVCIGPTPFDPGAVPTAVIEVDAPDEWLPLPQAALKWLASELETRNIVAAWTKQGNSSHILVEELEFGQRPSMVAKDLSAADILQHWSLLSAAQRADHLDRRLGSRDLDPEAPIGGPVPPETLDSTMFDAFSGILHGFLVLKRRLVEAFQMDRGVEAETWLLGSRHDSVGTLLGKVLAEPAPDPVRHVIFGMCASELLTLTAHRRPGLLAAQPAAVAALRDQIRRLEAGWDHIEQGPIGEVSFRVWLESWWTNKQELRA